MLTRRTKIKKNTLLLFIIYVDVALVGCLLGLFFGNSAVYTDFLGISSVFLSGWVAWVFRKNTSLFISFFFVAYSVYSIYIAVYVFPEIRPQYYYSQFGDNSVYVIGLQCVFLYSLTTAFIVKANISRLKRNEFVSHHHEEPYKTNWLIVSGCVAVIAALTATEFTYNGISTRATGTALYEYRIVFFVAGMIHSRKSRAGKYMWLILVILSAALSFVGGNRADAIPLIIAYIYFYHNNASPKIVTPILVGAVLVMVSLGMYRQTLLSGTFNFRELLSKIWEEKFTFDTAHWAYVSSLGSVAMSATDSAAVKIELFWYQVLYVLFGGKYNDKKLEFYTLSAYKNNGGYVSPTYFYYWIGILGPIVLAVLVCAYIKVYFKKTCVNADTMVRHDVYAAISAYFVATSPRWFLYDPYSLIRGMLIMVVGILLASSVSTMMFRSKRHTSKRSETQ